MSWPGSRNKCAAALTAGLVVGAMAVGCARPQGVLFPAIDPPLVWPAPPEAPRIRLVGTISNSQDLRAAQSGLEVLGAALRGSRPPIGFTGPHAVAVRGRDLVAVADEAGGAVHLIDLSKRTHRLVTGWKDDRFAAPVGLAWVGNRLFVTDAARHEVIELDLNGRFLGRFGQDILTRPVGIAYSAQRDQLYVVDGGAHCVKVFDPVGSLVATIGQRGTGPGEFNYPSHIGCARDRLLVSDSGNFRIQLLDLDGRCLSTVGQKGDGAGDFALPKGVAFDRDGHVYVVDARFENIQIFDDEGNLLLALGEEGRGPGELWLPAGIAIDEIDRIWVADSGNKRLQVFAYLRTSS